MLRKLWLSWMFGALGKEKVKFDHGSSMQLLLISRSHTIKDGVTYFYIIFIASPLIFLPFNLTEKLIFKCKQVTTTAEEIVECENNFEI